MENFILWIYPHMMIIIISLLYCLVCAVICRTILNKKGYPKKKNYGLIWGFFLGIIGIIVCALYPPYGNTDVTIADETINADALLKYKQLLDSGVITQQEFDRKKNELMR